MNRRVLLLILLLVILGGGGLLLANQAGLLSPAQPAPTPGPTGLLDGGATPNSDGIVAVATPDTDPVLVAVQDLKRGAVIPEQNAVQLVEFPAGSISDFYRIEDPREAIGQIARVDIPIGSPVLRTMLTRRLGPIGGDGQGNGIGSGGSDAALVVPKGYVAISIPIDRLSNVAHAVKDGDYVDVIVSFLFVDVDEEFQSVRPNNITITTIGPDGQLTLLDAVVGRAEPSSDFPTNTTLVVSPTERQRPRLATQLTVQRAFVIHVGTFPENGDFLPRRPSPTAPPVTADPNAATATPQIGPTPTPVVFDPDIITLAVLPQEALVLAYVVESGLPTYLTLRSIESQSPQDIFSTTVVTLDYLTRTYRILQPRRLPYALEPRIKSIRSTIPGDISTDGLSESTGGATE